MTEPDSWSEFWSARVWGQIDGLIYTLIMWAAAAALGWLSRATIIARLKLGTRITLGLLLLTVVASGALWVGVTAQWTIITFAISSIVLVWFALRGVSGLGIINAFRTTTEGISAEKSLKLVKSRIMFLGIGAHKLTRSSELKKAFERCKRSSGSVRFLLSDPDNEGLKRLSGQNQKSGEAYSLRVRESITEIIHQAELTGVQCEIRLYQIDNEKALSRFRMMFIDDRLCIFSHVVWNDKEGLDNSQLILLKSAENVESGLYSAYLAFYEDLWSASTPVNNKCAAS